MTLNFIFKWFEIPFPCTIFAPQTTWVGRSFHSEIPLQPVVDCKAGDAEWSPYFRQHGLDTLLSEPLAENDFTLLDAWCCRVYSRKMGIIELEI